MTHTEDVFIFLFVCFYFPPSLHCSSCRKIEMYIHNKKLEAINILIIYICFCFFSVLYNNRTHFNELSLYARALLL